MCHCKSNKSQYDKKKVDNGCNSKPITQCLVNKANGNLAILKSGNYHLAEDIRGTISIKSCDVCLDLCCHTLDANGANNAIVIGELLQESSTHSMKKSKSLPTNSVLGID